MNLQVTVRGISQDIDFDTGDQTNFVLLEMPRGGVFRAAVEDTVAQMLMDAATGNGSARPSNEQAHGLSPEESAHMQAVLEQRPQAMQMTEDDNGQPVLDFVGSGTAAASPEVRKMSLEQLEKLPQELVMKGKNVNSGMLDEMGNLRSIPGGGVDAGEVVGDEDDMTDSI